MIPNFLTLLNLFSGCVGIVLTFTGHSIGVIWCIGLSLAFDFLDGLMARLLGQSHPLGGDLDSLADVVSFGVLPGVMYYHMIDSMDLEDSLRLFSYVGFIFTVLGAYRLARFNVMHGSETHFSGLPIPSAAIFVTGLYWVYQSAGCESCAAIFINPYVLFVSIFFLGYLMVSNVPHFSFKVKGIRWKGQEIQWIFLLLVVFLAVTLKEAAVTLSIVLYIFLSLVYFTFRRKPN